MQCIVKQLALIHCKKKITDTILSKKKPTIVDIANVLNISPSAVSKALSDHPRMSQKTKKQVLQVADKLGYKRNIIATGLRKGRSRLIGVMVPWVNLNFFSTAIKGIEDVLAEAGYHVLIGQSKDSEEKEKNQIDAFLNAQVEGIIVSLASTTTNLDHFKNALKTGTKLILFDRTSPDLGVDEVVVDDYRGGFLATEHLIQQGYRRIGLISETRLLLPYGQRMKGYMDALVDNDMDFDDSLIVECQLSIDNGKEMALKMLASDNPPDAIFCLSDLFALGALSAIRSKGLLVPEDIGLVGFSNEDFTTYVSPSISTIDQFSEQLGQIAAKSILEQLEQEEEKLSSGMVSRKHVLAPMLIERNSSQKNKK